MTKRFSQSGMTLVEVLIATGIFALASMIALLTTIQINNLQYHNRIQQRLQEESRYALEFINREVAKASSLSSSGDSITIAHADGTNLTISYSDPGLTVSESTNLGVSHTLTGGDVRIPSLSDSPVPIDGWVVENAGTNSINITLTLQPNKRDILQGRKSPYIGPQKVDPTSYRYTIKTTITIPD